MEVNIQDFYDSFPIDEKRIIPNQIFQTWKTSFFDKEHASLLQAFRNNNKEISFHFFDDKKMINYMEEVWGKHPIFKVFTDTQIGAAKADIWRYCILYDRGGIYLDIDSLILFKLINIPEDYSELISFENNLLSKELRIDKYPYFQDMFSEKNKVFPKLMFPHNIILNWAMIFKKAHIILDIAINFIVEHSHFFKKHTQFNMLNSVLHFSGPLVLTYSVWKYLQSEESINQAGIDFNGGAIFKAYTAGTYGSEKHYSAMNNQILFK